MNLCNNITLEFAEDFYLKGEVKVLCFGRHLVHKLTLSDMAVRFSLTSFSEEITPKKSRELYLPNLAHVSFAYSEEF